MIAGSIHRLPSLDYHHVFDLCAMSAHQQGGTAAIWTSQAFCAEEFHQRHIPAITLDDRTVLHDFLIWALPDAATRATVGDDVSASLNREGRLCIITAGWLAQRLPEHQTSHASLASLRQMHAWLRANNFNIVKMYGVHSVSSILYGYSARLMKFLGQDDLADRQNYRMRATYLARSGGVWITPLQVTIARRCNCDECC